MKKCRSYTGFLTVIAFLTIIFLSPGCGESYPIPGSEDGVPELASSDGSVHMAPNASAVTLSKSNQKKSKDRKVEPDEVFFKDLLPSTDFAVLLIYQRGIHERHITLVFEAILSIPEIIHGVYTDEGSCDNGVPNAARNKYYNSMISDTSRATIPILNDGSMDRVYIDVDGDELYDYVLKLSPSEN